MATSIGFTGTATDGRGIDLSDALELIERRLIASPAFCGEAIDNDEEPVGAAREMVERYYANDRLGDLAGLVAAYEWDDRQTRQ